MEWVWGFSAIGLVAIIWLIVLTVLLIKERQSIQQLFPQSDERNIKSKLNELLAELADVKEREKVIFETLKQLATDVESGVQTIEILRYNPYGDVGGDQSFSVALLTGRDNGVILSSMHSRSGTRVYAKSINAGQAEIKLSKEEQQVLDAALNKD